MSAARLSGADPISHHADGDTGVLLLHGFTGHPGSVRLQAEALVDAGHHVEMPLLPGHGTVVEDMLTTGWADWSGEADAAYERLAERADRIVIAGQSMGGTLALQTALRHPPARGVCCINPVTLPLAADVVELIREMVAEGVDVAPGAGSDIADPEVVDAAYEGSPLRPLLSFFEDGVEPLDGQLASLTSPLLLLTSRQDHVVEPANSEHLAATYGGPVEHVWLERSYHVATQDYDRDVVCERLLQFVAKVTAP